YEPRYYFTQIPQNFDPAKPYPVLFYGQGCGQTNPENGPFTAFASEYFIVQLIPAAVTAETVEPEGGSPGCFQAGRRGLADSPDLAYFDQVLAEISAKYCIDMGQLYVAGWSSGAWLSNYLACARGNVLRGTSSGSGGIQFEHGACTGGAISMIFPGDAGDETELDQAIGAAVARDLLVQTNGCSTTPVDMPYGDVTCQVYGDCAAPIAYCPDPGGHGGPLGPLAASSRAFWNSIP
ncbi:MAG TPA: hypothetical protein VM686_37395, partial [Polyangiaceae bacterium]|nr:hypothetical protein [Polyangiaceae bacterium]